MTGAGDGTTTSGPLSVRVKGLSRTLRDLEKAGASATDLRDAMQRIGNLVVMEAAPRAPRDSGRMASTLRAGRAKTKAVVRMGGARAPYAGVIEYGWPKRNITARPSLSTALDARRAQILTVLVDEIDQLLSKNHLT